MPLTEEHLHEFEDLGVDLQAYHIVCLAQDIGSVKTALQAVPNRRRPRVSAEPSAGCRQHRSKNKIPTEQAQRQATEGESFKDMVEVEVAFPRTDSSFECHHIGDQMTITSRGVRF